MSSCTDLKRPLLASLLLSALAGCGKMSNVTRGAGFGVNLAGAEFGALRPDFSNANAGTHGTDYFFPSRDAMVYYANRGISLVRVPLSWERLQPRLGEQLDPGYLARILECLDHASQLDCSVVLDVHNYGRYRLQRGDRVEELIVADQRRKQSELDSSFLVDLWLRLSDHVRGHPAVTAYGLMNEPHDMAGADWHATSNKVVSALRGAGDQTWIWVAGDAWSSAEKWNRYNPPRPWVHDDLGRIAYEAHVYFDANGSGKYERSYAEETRLDPRTAHRGRERMQPFLEWCDRNSAVGVIGEFGVPWSDPGWMPVLEEFLMEVRRHDIKACAWAGGDYWGDYPLSLQARDGQDVATLKRLAWHNSQSASPLMARPPRPGPAGR